MSINPEITQQALLGRIQSDFPVTERPFRKLAGELGLTEEDVLREVRELIESKIIREFNPVFDARRLGYVSTLAAVKIDYDRVAELASELLEVPEVTHNYLRDCEINLWFTVTARDERKLRAILKRVSKFPGVRKIMNLPVLKTFKIRAVFDGQDVSPPRDFPAETDVEPISLREEALIRSLQNDFPVEATPFRTVARRCGMDESDVLDTVSRWVENGVIRRFGARLNHKKAGYTANILTAWKGQETDQWGTFFAELPYVSHCYRRATDINWNYELYAMVHAKSDEEIAEHINTMKTIAPGASFIQLRTVYELKKTAMRYFLEEVS